MNKRGASPSLTTIFIAVAIGITIITLAFSSVITFSVDNSNPYTSDINGVNSQLSSQQSELYGFGNDLEDQSLIEGIWDGAEAGVNVFVTGLGAISKFFSMIPLVKNIMGIMQNSIPGFEPLFGLFVLIITVYIVMRILSGRRGVGEAA